MSTTLIIGAMVVTMICQWCIVGIFFTREDLNGDKGWMYRLFLFVPTWPLVLLACFVAYGVGMFLGIGCVNAVRMTLGKDKIKGFWL